MIARLSVEYYLMAYRYTACNTGQKFQKKYNFMHLIYEKV